MLVTASLGLELLLLALVSSYVASQDEMASNVAEGNAMPLYNGMDEQGMEDRDQATKSGKKTHKLRYQHGDYRPHFGYVRGHYGFDHKARHSSKYLLNNTLGDEKTEGGTPLTNYVVRVQQKSKTFCSGLIVSQQEVLSVGNCYDNTELPELRVKLFDNSKHNISSMSVADDYTYGQMAETLVLLRLAEPLSEMFKKQPPICRWRLPVREEVVTWNWASKGMQIKKKEVKQMSLAECKQTIDDPDGKVLDKGTSCVVNTKTTDKCLETFGLPFVWNGHFCGMNIMGHNCPHAVNADVYIKLLRIKVYIKEKLQQRQLRYCLLAVVSFLALQFLLVLLLMHYGLFEDTLTKRLTLNHEQLSLDLELGWRDFVALTPKRTKDLYQYNQNLSDKYGPLRALPTVQHDSCNKRTYTLPHASRARISVIISYYNEARSVLLRTLVSLIKRTPEDYLHELVVIDDYSDDGK
ncbi:CG10000 [Drosophila busckii]|uniref:CG10000 n=1 Tax=Drosophila busckii TaxID=30019 RepID=A0A0M3QY93_DROBS|nr:CG10000 [Drosophila busckii]